RLERMLDERAPSPALIRLSLRLGVRAAYPLAMARAADEKGPAAERAEFLRALGELGRAEALPTLLGALGRAQPVPVRGAALLALRRFDSPEVAAAVIDRYATMPT